MSLPPIAAPHIKLTFDFTAQLQVIADLGLKQGWLEKLEEKLSLLGIFDEVDLSGHYNIATLSVSEYDTEAIKEASRAADKALATFYKKFSRSKK